MININADEYIQKRKKTEENKRSKNELMEVKNNKLDVPTTNELIHKKSAEQLNTNISNNQPQEELKKYHSNNEENNPHKLKDNDKRGNTPLKNYLSKNKNELNDDEKDEFHNTHSMLVELHEIANDIKVNKINCAEPTKEEDNQEDNFNEYDQLEVEKKNSKENSQKEKEIEQNLEAEKFIEDLEKQMIQELGQRVYKEAYKIVYDYVGFILLQTPKEYFYYDYTMLKVKFEEELVDFKDEKVKCAIDKIHEIYSIVNGNRQKELYLSQGFLNN